MWTIWVERNELTFKINTIWDIKDMQQMVLQEIIKYAGIAWDVACKEVNKATVYDDTLRNYDKIWGGIKILYHRDNTRIMHWNTIAPNVGSVRHV